MKRTLSDFHVLLSTVRHLAAVQQQLRYWLHAPAWWAPMDILTYGGSYLRLVREARASRRFWFARCVEGAA